MSENNTTVLLNGNTPVFGENNPIVLNCGMSISHRLRTCRKKAGFSQEELADIVGCTQGLISKLERGDQTETAYIVEIANALKVRPEYLLCKDDLENSISDLDFSLETDSNYSVKEVKSNIHKIPLIDLDEAHSYERILEKPTDYDYIISDAKEHDHLYAVKMPGDSMEPVFKDGTVLVIDPDMSPVPGDYVVAKGSSYESTIKKLVKDGPDWYLKSENQQFPIKDASLYEIIGVVIQAQTTTKFK